MYLYHLNSPLFYLMTLAWRSRPGEFNLVELTHDVHFLMAIDNLTPELKFARTDDCDTIDEHHERYLPG